MARACGNWQAAREFSDRGFVGSPREEPRLLVDRVLQEYELGEFGQGAAYLERLLKVTRLSPPGATVERVFLAGTILAAARTTGVANFFEAAQEAVQTILSYPSATPLIAEGARISLALMAVHRGDAVAAEEECTGLLEFSGVSVVFGISTKHLLGLVAQTMGILDQASEHFEEALAFRSKAGYRPELAWTCCDYADTLLQRDDECDRAKVMSLLDESLRISSELGMRPLMERVLSRREILKV